MQWNDLYWSLASLTKRGPMRNAFFLFYQAGILQVLYHSGSCLIYTKAGIPLPCSFCCKSILMKCSYFLKAHLAEELNIVLVAITAHHQGARAKFRLGGVMWYYRDFSIK